MFDTDGGCTSVQVARPSAATTDRSQHVKTRPSDNLFPGYTASVVQFAANATAPPSEGPYRAAEKRCWTRRHVRSQPFFVICVFASHMLTQSARALAFSISWDARLSNMAGGEPDWAKTAVVLRESLKLPGIGFHSIGDGV